ncbi:MAG: RNA polymerase sigma factor [Planctomycetota bacterium]
MSETPRPASAPGPCAELGLGRPDLTPLHRLALGILGCPDLAEEAVQEALIALWRADPRPQRPPAWLARTTVLRALHHLRTASRRTKHECRAAQGCELHLDPARGLEREEVRARVRRALDEIPPEFRVPLELHALEGLDYRSIAERERLPVGTVRSRIHRARKRLCDLLAGAA